MSVSEPVSLPREAQRLLSLIDALSQSGSMLEGRFWEAQLEQQLDRILAARKNRHIESVLEYLGQNQPDAYDLLIDKAEAHTETLQVDDGDTPLDALLITAPINAWTRYQLPDGRLDKARLLALMDALRDTVLAPGARLTMADTLLNFESLPQSFHATRALTRQLAQAALADQPTLRITDVPSPGNGMLADVRYLVALVLVPRGQAVFRWQGQPAHVERERAHCALDWETRCTPILDPLFTGCHAHYLRPDAYYSNSREAEQRIRPLVLRAAIAWLQAAANVPPEELRAAIVGCGDPMLQEYRVGFSTRQDNTVIYGCQWPILSREEAFNEMMDGDTLGAVEEITALLREEGVGEVRRLPDCSMAEFCEDCGAPFFPDMMGELQHPELPEETNLDPVLLH